MRVVVAPDKFKGSLTGAQVAAAVAEGLRSVQPGLELSLLPIADGGDGTVDAAAAAGFDRVDLEAFGPTSVPVRTSYARRGHDAVVELATVVGLERLPRGELQPLTASTYGLGVVMADAIAGGAQRIVLGLGGSASTDGGAGMVQALGARLLDPTGAELGRGGAALLDLAALDLSALDKRLAGVQATVASDVDNPLLGARGAAAVFGPQKGATPADVTLLEAALERWAEVVGAATGLDLAASPGGGAAGGTAYAAMTILGADLVAGIELILDLVGFHEAVRGADLVITGEGSLDEQSLSGKAPIGVATAARAAGVPVIAVAGRSLLSPERLLEAGIRQAYLLSALEPDVDRSMAHASTLLAEVGRRIAAEWLA